MTQSSAPTAFTSTSTTSSMLSFIQHLIASAGTHTSSSFSSSSSSTSSRKRKRSPSPKSASTSHNASTTGQNIGTPETPQEQVGTGTTGSTISASADRENEISMFLALAGEAPIVKRVRTEEDWYRHGQMDVDIDGNGDVPKQKKKLSVICEETDSDEYEDVDMQDIRGGLSSLKGRQIWTYRGGDGLQR